MPRLRWYTNLAVLTLSITIFVQMMYYFYGSSVGIDIDPNLLISDNTYYRDVEEAVRSASIEDKVNVLLRGQLKGFNNISAILQRTRAVIFYCTVGLAVSVLLAFVARRLDQIYPRAFFAIGTARERLRRFERYREIWAVGVALAFIINVVAGLVLTFLQ